MAIKINIKDKGKKAVPTNKDPKKSNNLFSNRGKNVKTEKQEPQKISVTSYAENKEDVISNGAALDIESKTKENILTMIKDVKPTDKEDKLPKKDEKEGDVEKSMKQSVGLLKMMGYTDEDIYESFV